MSACYKYLPLTMMVSRQSNNGCNLWCPVVMILWKTYRKQSNHKVYLVRNSTLLMYTILSDLVISLVHSWYSNLNCITEFEIIITLHYINIESMILWLAVCHCYEPLLRRVLTMMRKSAWVPVNTGMSIGTRTEYGLFSRTPKFRSPLRRRRINTPMCIRPTRAKNHIETEVWATILSIGKIFWYYELVLTD